MSILMNNSRREGIQSSIDRAYLIVLVLFTVLTSSVGNTQGKKNQKAEGAKPSAETLAKGSQLFLEKTCVACHGKDAKTPLLPDYPKIAGQSKAYIERQMLDIKSGARANGNSAAMNGIMILVNEEEIKILAEYVSSLKP